MSVAIAIITKNEIRNIKDSIMNAKMLTEEILVVDSGSTDGTVEIAKDLGAKVIYRDWDNFANQRNYAMACTEAEWMVFLDADERMDERLIEEIREIVCQNKEGIYECVRYNSAFGKSFKYGVLGPDSVKRIFPRNKVKWVGAVHERPEGNLPIIPIKGSLKHYTYVDFDQYLSKQNKYSTMWAKDHRGKKKVNILKDIFVRPGFAFIKMYFLKRGFLEGMLGFVLSCCYMNYTLAKYVKLYLENKKN